MIKGALIFATGLGVGYAVAMGNQDPNGKVKESAAEFLRTMKGVVVDAHLDAKNEAKAEKQAQEEGIVQEGVAHLLDRLRKGLDQIADYPDFEVVLKNDVEEPLLYVGDLRAPFHAGPYSVDEVNETETTEAEEPHDAEPQGETPS